VRGQSQGRWLGLLTALAALGLPAAADGATQLGQRPAAGFGSCIAGYNWVQTSVSSGTPYEVPAGGGVITRWQYRGGSPNPGSGRLQVWTPPTGGANFTLVGRSELVAFSAGVLSDSPTRVPVSGGELLGMRMHTFMDGCSFNPGVGGNVLNYEGGGASDPVPGETRTLASEGTSGAFRLPLTATLEPDADRDGFGDETQDQCPTDASTQGACPTSLDTDPPETEITKSPANQSNKSKAKYKFTSDESGSSFECALKGGRLDEAVKNFGDCDSPRTYKYLDRAKFKFQVRAIDASGNVDPTPAKDKFKVVG
jgi:hypothetical protein